MSNKTTISNSLPRLILHYDLFLLFCVSFTYLLFLSFQKCCDYRLSNRISKNVPSLYKSTLRQKLQHVTINFWLCISLMIVIDELNSCDAPTYVEFAHHVRYSVHFFSFFNWSDVSYVLFAGTKNRQCFRRSAATMLRLGDVSKITKNTS